MSVVPIFSGRVLSGGLLVLDAPKDYAKYVRSLHGQFVEVVVRKLRTQRSLDQNAYWWAVPVRLLAEHCGYTDDQMHYVLLGECFGYVIGPHGHDIPNVASSSKLTTDEFSRLIEWVLVWGPTEMGVEIPPPNKVAA